jgi:DNA-directed RNA polymerase specialized sigma24 family protein
MKDHPAVLKFAHKFAATTDVELDDLLQEGRLAVHRARRAADRARELNYPRGNGGYDPHVSAFDTYTTHAVYRGMCSALRKHRRQNRLDIVASLDDTDAPQFEDAATPSPDRRLLLAELIRELPEDARAVIALVLDDVPGLGTERLRRRRAPPGSETSDRGVKSYIRRTLGLSHARANAAFAAVSAMLEEMV